MLECPLSARRFSFSFFYIDAVRSLSLGQTVPETSSSETVSFSSSVTFSISISLSRSLNVCLVWGKLPQTLMVIQLVCVCGGETCNAINVQTHL